MSINIKKNKVCIFGIGQVFEDTVEIIKDTFDVIRVCDNRTETWNCYFHDLLCIEPEELCKMKDTLVLVTVGSIDVYKEICKQLDGYNIEYVHISEVKEVDLSFLPYGIPYKQVCTTEIYDNYYDQNTNKISFEGKSIPQKCNIMFSGKNNHIIFKNNMVCRSELTINCFGDDNKVIFYDNVYIGRPDMKSEISVYNGSTCKIGKDTDIQQCTIIVNEGGRVEIGKNCMLSYDITIRQSDFHPIYDNVSKKRINKSKDIIVGDCVWLGERSSILAGANIGAGSVVGFGTITSSCFPNNVLIAGSPAKILRNNISWSKEKIK